MRTSKFVVFALFTLLVSVSARPAAAQVKQATPQLAIQAAYADLTANQLLITGQQFGERPAVVLDGIPLAVTFSDPQQIVATLPSGAADHPGTYRLIVSRGRGDTQYDVFAVTVGVAGPTGDKGDRAIPAPRGPRG